MSCQIYRCQWQCVWFADIGYTQSWRLFTAASCCCACIYAGQKVFSAVGQSIYTMEEWLALCEYEKVVVVQLSERNDMKNLMDRVELIANQLISETIFLFASCKIGSKVRRMMTALL